MRDSKGYQVLGFESFEAWGEVRFNFKKPYLYQLAKAAEIQKNLGESAIADNTPESQLRPLSKDGGNSEINKFRNCGKYPRTPTKTPIQNQQKYRNL